MSSQLFDDVLAEPATKKAFKAVSSHAPEDGSNQDEILQLITDFVQRAVEIAATAELPDANSAVPTSWKEVAQGWLEAADYGTLVHHYRGELRGLGMPFGLLLNELAIAAASDALRLRSTRRY